MNSDRSSFGNAEPGLRWPGVTLRTQLVALILAATLPLLVLMTARTVAEAESQRQGLMANLHRSARAVAIVVDRELTASRAALAALALTDSLRLGDLKAFEQHLRSPGRLRGSWTQLAVMDSSGRLLFEVGRPEAPQRSLSEATELAALARAWSSQLPNGVLLSVPVIESAGAAQHRTWVGITATTAHGERHLLASRISPAVWQSLLEGAASDGDSDTEVTLFDDRQRVIARSVAPRLPANRLPPASSVASSANRSSDVPITRQIESGKRYAGWQFLTDGGWKVGVRVPAASFDAVQRSTVLSVFGVTAACLLLGVAFSLWAMRFVVAGLQQRVNSGGGTDGTPTGVAELAQLREAAQGSGSSRDGPIAREKTARGDAQATSRTEDQLLCMLGHEMRNPLNAIVTSVEVLRAAEQGSNMAHSARAVLSRQVHKLSRMFDELPAVWQVMAGQITLALQPVELRTLLGSSIEAALPHASEKSLRLRLDAPAQVWVTADASRIEQVMAHLLENAIKHSPAAGQIDVRLTVVEEVATVSVDDNGAGIDPELLSRVFEPFVQSELGPDRSTWGLGIGLAVVKRFVEMHGGCVYAHSSSQCNSFGWRMPATPASAPLGRTV